jgi:hypothetical protein
MGKGRIFVAGALGCAALLPVGCSFAPSFSENEKIGMRDTTSQYQRVVLKDLVVTEAEYRRAVNATRDCLQDEGFGVGPMTEQDGNQLGFQSSYGGHGRPSDQIMKACDEGFLTEVGPIWVSQRTPLTS